MSKSLPVDVNNSANNLRMTHICPLRKEKGRWATGYECETANVITVVKVLLTDPVTKRCGRCRLTISCSDETKKGGRGAESG